MGAGAGLAAGAAPPRPGGVRVGRRGSSAGSVRCCRWTSRWPSSRSAPGVRRPVPASSREALADGRVIKAFAFRGSMHYLSPEDGGMYLALRSAGRQWERRELGRLLPPGSVRLARLPGRRTRGARRRPADRHRARRGAGEPSGVPAPEAGLRRRRGHAGQAADVAGRHELRTAARRAAHLPAAGHQPTLAGHPQPRRGRTARDHGVPADLRAGHARSRALLAGVRAERRTHAARPLDHRAG